VACRSYFLISYLLNGLVGGVFIAPKCPNMHLGSIHKICTFEGALDLLKYRSSAHLTLAMLAESMIVLAESCLVRWHWTSQVHHRTLPY
jgi:hypothetical protein